MLINLEYLREKYLEKNFHNDEELFNFVSTDVIFGFSEISDILKNDSEIRSVLEIGSGAGILLNELKKAFPNIDFSGVDPNESGFHRYKEVYESLKKKEFIIENSQIEKFETTKKFDLVFSINVFEHVRDWKKYIEQTNKLLNKNGKNIILAPNYDFPYEPHFVIPIIINKKITKFFFKNKIKRSEIKTNEIGLWEGLYFLGKKEVERYLTTNNYSYYFDFEIKQRMFNRIIQDKEFKRRQGIGGSLAIFAKNLYLDKLIFDFFKVPFPYMKLIIDKKNS